MVSEPLKGWEPICKFLGKPVPNQPFPHENRLGSVIDELANDPHYQATMKRQYIGWINRIVMIVGELLFYMVHTIWGSRAIIDHFKAPFMYTRTKQFCQIVCKKDDGHFQSPKIFGQHLDILPHSFFCSTVYKLYNINYNINYTIWCTALLSPSRL